MQNSCTAPLRGIELAVVRRPIRGMAEGAAS
jgi:hypothetical protein